MADHDPLPSVTVVLPTYNARAWVMRAVESVLAQTVTDFELVIVDDGSSDGTPVALAERYRHEHRIRVVSLPRNSGPAHARNVGLRAARGAWIALIDADDAWRAERLERLLPATADADMVFDNMMGRDPASGIESGALFPRFPAGELTVEALLAPFAPGSRYDYGYLKPLMRSAFMRAKGIRYDPRLRTSEDLLLYLTMLLEGARTRMIDKPLYVYTTPVSHATGGASAFSNTAPRDDDVLAALSRVRTQYAGRMDAATSRSIERRIDHLREVRPVAEFDFARRRRDYRRAAALLAGEAGVRREVISRLRRRFRQNGADGGLSRRIEE